MACSDARHPVAGGEQVGVVDRHRRSRGEPVDEVEVVLAEAAAVGGRHEGQDAEHPAVGHHRHDGSGLGADPTVEVEMVGVAACRGLQHLVGDVRQQLGAAAERDLAHVPEPTAATELRAPAAQLARHREHLLVAVAGRGRHQVAGLVDEVDEEHVAELRDDEAAQVLDGRGRVEAGVEGAGGGGQERQLSLRLLGGDASLVLPAQQRRLHVVEDAALGDVGGHADHAQRAPGDVEHRATAHLDPTDLAVGPAEAVQRVEVATLLERLVGSLVERVAVLLEDQVGVVVDAAVEAGRGRPSAARVGDRSIVRATTSHTQVPRPPAASDRSSRVLLSRSSSSILCRWMARPTTLPTDWRKWTSSSVQSRGVVGGDAEHAPRLVLPADRAR